MCSYCTVICTPKFPKRRGCGSVRVSVCFIIRGWQNIPNQSYKTQLHNWSGEKKRKFVDVKHLLLVINRCFFPKSQWQISQYFTGHILWGQHSKSHAGRASSKLAVTGELAVKQWPGSPAESLHPSILQPTPDPHLCILLSPSQDAGTEQCQKLSGLSSLSFAKNCSLFWVESNFFTISL